MSGFNWKIAGAAGEGIKKAGLIFAKTCFKHGLNVHGYTEYPSLIRGGHNTFQILASQNDVYSPKYQLDILIGLHENSPQLHKNELSETSITLYQKNFPLNELVKQAGGSAQMKNMAALGASVFLLGLSLEKLNQTLAEVFNKKGLEIIKTNQKVAQAGYDYAQNNLKELALPIPQTSAVNNPNLFLTGNQAIALGAIAGGLKLYLAYPMTPATSILHFLAQHQKKAQIVVRHGEDEIGVINMALGASFAGVRTMVATSGGGFSLMNEGLGLSGITETPMVIVNSMRPGPATGMPTWSSQGDLLFAIHASQDEFPRIILTPGDPYEAFQLTKLALNLAEKYQLPVILLTDKYLSESYFTVKKFDSQHQNQRYGFLTPPPAADKPYPRYQESPTGVSARPMPGQIGGVHLTNSYEHDQFGYATESSSDRNFQVQKRAKKIPLILKNDLVKPILHGSQTAPNTIISWGSNKGAILHSLPSLKETNFIHLPWVWPFPQKELKELTQTSQNIYTIECNSTGQLYQLIKQQTNLKIKKSLLKYDGRPFFPEEIINFFNQT